MGVSRNGARTFLEIMRKACKLSHTPGFATGLNEILGPNDGIALNTLWNAVCLMVEALIAADNYYNRLDTVAGVPGDEDTGEIGES